MSKVKINNVIAIQETVTALLVEINGTRHWIPKSQIDDDSEVYKAHTDGLLVISAWIAQSKGLV